jgi:hypothetical protein
VVLTRRHDVSRGWPVIREACPGNHVATAAAGNWSIIAIFLVK